MRSQEYMEVVAARVMPMEGAVVDQGVTEEVEVGEEVAMAEKVGEEMAVAEQVGVAR